jgi:hypothetical protein
LASVSIRASKPAAETRDLDSELDARLRRWSWPFVALLVSIVPIARTQWGVGELVALPLLAAAGVAVWTHFAKHPAPSAPAEHLEDASADSISKPSTWPALRFPGGVRAIFLGGVIPLLIYAWLYDGFLVHHRIDMHHEGELLAPWNALQSGAVPFRDIYIQHGLFQNVGKGWLAAKLFGVSLASLRTTEHLLAPFGHVALYFLGLALFRSWISAVLLVLVASVANSWTVDRQALGLLAVAALAQATRGGQLARTPLTGSWLAGLWANPLTTLSGVATTLAFFYSSEIGIFSATACTGFLLIRLLFDGELRGRQRWIPLAAYLVGAIVCFLPFASVLVGVDALDDLVRNTWQQIAYQPTVWGRPYPSLVSTLQSVTSPSTAVAALFGKWFQWYLPPLIYLLAVGHLTLRALQGRLWRRPESGVLLLALLTALCYFGSSLSRADSFHLGFGTLLMWGFVGLALEDALRRGFRRLESASGAPARLRAVVWPGFACAGVAIYLVAVHDPIGQIGARVEQIASGRYWPRHVRTAWPRLGGIRIGDSEFAHIREVVGYVQQHARSGQAIFDFSSQPAYYFLADRPNPTRYALAAYAATREMQREVIDDIERSTAPLVIYRSGGYLDNLDGVPFAKRSALIESYLRSRYDKAHQIGGTVILLRKDQGVRDGLKFKADNSNPESSSPP